MQIDGHQLTLAGWEEKKRGRGGKKRIKEVAEGTLEYNQPKRAPPQPSRNGSRLKLLTRNVATLDSPFTVLRTKYRIKSLQPR